MNVVRLENNLAPARGRAGKGRGRGRAGIFHPTSNQIINVVPKYEFKTDRRPLVNTAPSSSTCIVTPKNARKYQTTSSSSNRKSSCVRRPGQTSGGQISPYSISSESDTCVIVAITSGRGDARGEVGLAAIDVQYPHMILSQISDCNTYINTLTKINTLSPVEIIMPDTMCERSAYSNGLYHAIREKFDSIPITSIARMHFHDSSGMDRIRTHCAEEFSSIELFVKQKYYALAAASALLKYVEYIQHIVYAPKSMRIDYQGSQNTVTIDIESAQSLELVTSQDVGGRCSLFGCLNRCSTPMGRRLLRASILQPPCDLELTKSRQVCVAEFVTNRSFHTIVKPVVKRLYGASRLLSLAMLSSQADSVQAAEKNLNYILLLKNIIDTIPELRSVMSNGQAVFFQKVSADLKDSRYQSIMETILSIVQPEARWVSGFTSSNMERCFAIRGGINDMLDIARQTYCELIDDMQRLIEKLAERYNLPLSLGCNATLGYHIEMDVRKSQNIQMDQLPGELIEVHKQKNKIFMTTDYLLVLGQHCRDACAELHIMSNVLLNDVLTRVREHVGCLLKLSDNVGELDLLMSMAQISSISDYVMPTFGNRLELKSSRHPIMDISGTNSPVPNDIVATIAHNFNTITGPNMSGKSIYLKQIVLLQIMAQIGYYVPATKAQFRIADRIFCRMCSRQDIESNASTFVLEIKEAQYILQSATANSLVILDELCRGTTVEEGTSLAWSICEKLLRTTAFTFHATHFLYLTRLSEFYYNVKNYYFETESNMSEEMCNDFRLIYTHRLKPGVASVWNYGIALARSTGLPKQIVSLSRQFAEEIAKSVKPLIVESRTDAGKKACYDCFAEMSKLVEDDEFTVNNLIALVNRYEIPRVMKETQNLGQAERMQHLEKMNESFIRTNNSKQSNIEDISLTKSRLFTTKIASHSDAKKAKIHLIDKPACLRVSQLNYLRQQPTRSMSSTSSSEAKTKDQEFILQNSSSRDQRKEHTSSRFPSSPNWTLGSSSTQSSTLQIQRDNSDEKSRQSSPSFLNQLLMSQVHHRKTSQISGGSNMQRTTLDREADIFQIIEGNDSAGVMCNDIPAFYSSIQSTISTLSSDEEFY